MMPNLAQGDFNGLYPPRYNKNVTFFRNSAVFAASLAFVLWAIPLPASATALHFTLDTPALAGASASLAFDFLDGDGVVNNTITISDFATDGTLGVVSTLGGASGTLIPGPVTLSDTDFFNEFLQSLTLGTTLSFTLNLTEQAPVGPFADAFSFFLLDASGWLPLLATTDDPDPAFSAGTLFQVDIDGSPTGALQVFAPTDPGATVTWTVEPVVSVPLPSTALLLGAGLLGGLAMRRRSKHA